MYEIQTAQDRRVVEYQKRMGSITFKVEFENQFYISPKVGKHLSLRAEKVIDIAKRYLQTDPKIAECLIRNKTEYLDFMLISVVHSIFGNLGFEDRIERLTHLQLFLNDVEKEDPGGYGNEVMRMFQNEFNDVMLAYLTGPSFPRPRDHPTFDDDKEIFLLKFLPKQGVHEIFAEVRPDMVWPWKYKWNQVSLSRPNPVLNLQNILNFHKRFFFFGEDALVRDQLVRKKNPLLMYGFPFVKNIAPTIISTFVIVSVLKLLFQCLMFANGMFNDLEYSRHLIRKSMSLVDKIGHTCLIIAIPVLVILTGMRTIESVNELWAQKIMDAHCDRFVDEYELLWLEQNRSE